MLVKKPTPYYLARLNFTTSPQRTEELSQIAQKTLQQINRAGVNEKELKEAKNMWLTENSQGADSAGYWTEALAKIASDDGQYERLNQENAIISQLTTQDISALAKQYLGQNQKVFVMTP